MKTGPGPRSDTRGDVRCPFRMGPLGVPWRSSGESPGLIPGQETKIPQGMAKKTKPKKPKKKTKAPPRMEPPGKGGAEPGHLQGSKGRSAQRALQC